MWSSETQKQTFNAEKPPKKAVFQRKVVGVQGLEPWASCSQSRRATNCATPRYEVRRSGWAYSPKPPALPTALIPDIRFFCMIPCGEGKSKFFVSVGSAVVKPGFAGGSSGGGFPPQATVPRTSRLSLFGEWIGSLSSQITRAANYATFGHRYFSRPGAFFPTYVRQYTLRSAALALWHHLLLDRGQHDGFILYLSILPVSPPKSSLFASGRYVGKAVRRLWGLRTA